MTIYVLMVQEKDGRKCVHDVYTTWESAHRDGMDFFVSNVVHDFWVEEKECA